MLVAVLAAGGAALAQGRITPAQFFAAGQYAALGAGLGSLTGVLGRLARARAGARRAAEVLDLRAGRGLHVALPEGPLSGGLPDGPGRLELRGVVVRDAGGVLLDCDQLAVPGGATVAVVGRSGSGKSVLAAVAARLRDPDEGAVRWTAYRCAS